MTKQTATKSRKTSSKGKGVTFAALRVSYAKAHDISDVTIASKRLRAKLRGAYGKNPVVTKYVDRKGDNRDGNRYPDATAAEAKVILAL